MRLAAPAARVAWLGLLMFDNKLAAKYRYLRAQLNLFNTVCNNLEGCLERVSACLHC